MRNRWLGLFFGMIGLTLLVTAAVREQQREHWIAHARQVKGIVVRLDHGTDEDGDSLYRPVASFTADDGRSYLVQSTALSNLPPKVGTVVAIDYPIAHPEEALLVDWMGRWFDVTLMTGMGAMFLILGLFGRRSRAPSDFLSPG